MKTHFALLGSALVLVAGSGVALGLPASRGREVPGADIDSTLKDYSAQESSLTAERDLVEGNLQDTKTRVVGRGRAYYRQLRAGLLPAGGGFNELVDHAAAVERARLALVRDIDRQSNLERKDAELSDKLTRIQADRAPLEEHRNAMADARSVLHEEEERKAAFGRAFESSASPPDYVAIYGADVGPKNDGAASAFGSLFGHLPFPVSGRAEVHRLPRTNSHPFGIELVSPAGAVARSVAAGRVAFADKYDEDRLTVIVDHGDRYFTVYGNLKGIEVKVGEAVAPNTALGAIASKGGKPSLYFEIRKDGQAVDPGPWLGL